MSAVDRAREGADEVLVDGTVYDHGGFGMPVLDHPVTRAAQLGAEHGREAAAEWLSRHPLPKPVLSIDGLAGWFQGVGPLGMCRNMDAYCAAFRAAVDSTIREEVQP